MSKHLIKILSICALVVLVPLIVVGSAITVTQAAPATLTIYQGGNDGQYAGKSSTISILIDGVPQVDGQGQPVSTITVKKHSTVAVHYEGTGYEFAGWYDGTAQEVDGTETPLSTNTTYEFTIRGTTSLTAVRNAIQYQIQYSGTYDDGTAVGDIAEDHINTAVQTVEYGTLLATLTPQAGATFGGWYVENGDETVTKGTTNAIFNNVDYKDENGLITLTLKPVWSNQMLFTYYASDRSTIIWQDRITQEEFANYTLLSADNENVISNTTPGYRFVEWVDNVGNPVSIGDITYTTGEYSVYAREEVVSYDVTVEFNAIDTTDTTVITYNARDGFSDYSEERIGYTFQGLSYNGTLYSQDGSDYVFNGTSLGEAVIANEGLTVTAVWVCEYPDVTWDLTLISQEGTGIYYYDGTNYIPVEPTLNNYLVFEDVNEYGYAQLEDYIMATLLSDIDVNSLYVADGDSYRKVALTEAWVYNNANPSLPNIYDQLDTTDVTFKDLMDVRYDDLETITGITVRLIFA